VQAVHKTATTTEHEIRYMSSINRDGCINILGGRKGGRKGGKAGPRQDKEKKGKGKNKWNRMNRNETVSGEENTMEE